MYARVTFAQLQPARLGEGIHIVQDSISSAARQQRGFKNILLLTERTTGKSIIISLWETEADLRASEASGYYQEQLAKIMPLLITSTTREVYEVSAQI